MKIAHLLRWRGCAESHADELSDQTLDRVASKLSSGEIVDNLNAFAAAVARFVWLEHSRKHKADAVGDDLPEIPVEPDLSFLDGADDRIKCLRKCVVVMFTDEDKCLVVG